jgi:hypothetical protein
MDIRIWALHCGPIHLGRLDGRMRPSPHGPLCPTWALVPNMSPCPHMSLGDSPKLLPCK